MSTTTADIATTLLSDPAPVDGVPEPVRPAFLTAAELCQRYPRLREPLIEGILRRGEVGTLVSAPKMWKSYTLLNLAVCVALGLAWLGFATRRGRVLLIDLELHRETMAHRLPAVTYAMGLSVADLGDNLAIEVLRGKRRVDVYGLASYFASIGPGQFDLVIADPLYKLLPADADENSNVQMSNVFSAIQEYAELLQAGIVLPHHSTKGSQWEKNVTDVGSGAGSQSRAADSHLVLREHAEPGAAVLDGRLRSWPPIEPRCLRWSYPLWTAATDLDPADLKRPGRRPASKEPAESAQPPLPAWTASRVATECVGPDPKSKAAIIGQVAAAGGLSRRRAEALLDEAEGAGFVHRWHVPRDRRLFYANMPEPTLGGKS